MFDGSDQNRVKPNAGSPSTTFDHDQYDVDEFYRRMQAEQNLPLAIVAGFVAAMVGAVLWAFIAFGLRRPFAAIPFTIGLLVGQAVRVFGKGVTIAFPAVGALFAIFGCILGKVLSATAIYAARHNVEVTATLMNLLSRPIAALRVLVAMTGPMDALFYIVAIGAACKLSFRPAVFNEN